MFVYICIYIYIHIVIAITITAISLHTELTEKGCLHHANYAAWLDAGRWTHNMQNMSRCVCGKQLPKTEALMHLLLCTRLGITGALQGLRLGSFARARCNGPLSVHVNDWT